MDELILYTYQNQFSTIHPEVRMSIKSQIP